MFHFGDRRFSTPDPDSPFDLGDEDEATVTFMEVLGRKKLFGYEYDFGDSWAHQSSLKSGWKPSRGYHVPAACVDGKRACPPEDCGGVWGMPTCSKRSSAQYPEATELQWLGGSFDPEKFDVSAVNEQLAELPGPARAEDGDVSGVGRWIEPGGAVTHESRIGDLAERRWVFGGRDRKITAADDPATARSTEDS